MWYRICEPRLVFSIPLLGYTIKVVQYDLISFFFNFLLGPYCNLSLDFYIRFIEWYLSGQFFFHEEHNDWTLFSYLEILIVSCVILLKITQHFAFISFYLFCETGFLLQYLLKIFYESGWVIAMMPLILFFCVICNCRVIQNWVLTNNTVANCFLTWIKYMIAFPPF